MEANTKVVSENVELKKEERNRESKREFLTKEANTKVVSENVELRKEERNRERKREFLTTEASTKVVLENVELKKEEVKNKNKSNSNNDNNNNNKKNNNDGNNYNNSNIKKKEAAPVDPANGEVINAASAVVTTNDSSAQIKKKKNRKKKSNTRIQVSNTKKPFIFYLNLAKSCIKQYNNVELSALGMAIPTVITIAEILKRDGLVNNKEVKISTLDSKDDRRGSFIQKPKIQIVLGKAESLNKTITAADAATAPKVESDKQA